MRQSQDSDLLLWYINDLVCLCSCVSAWRTNGPDSCTVHMSMSRRSFNSLFSHPTSANTRLALCHLLVKRAPTSRCLHESVRAPTCLRTWSEVNVGIISAWGSCNYTVKVPMGRQPLHLVPRHVLSFYCVLCLTEKCWVCLRWLIRAGLRCECKLYVNRKWVCASVSINKCICFHEQQLTSDSSRSVRWPLIMFSVSVWEFKKCLCSAL